MPVVDTREAVLAQLFTIMGTMPAIVTNARNRGLMTNEKRPAQVLLDGDEQPRLSVDTNRIRGMQMAMAPQLVMLRPEIFYLPTEKRPLNNTPQNIGTEANAWRVEFLSRLWADTGLADILGSNGSIVYYGCETDMKSGSAMSGEIKLDFMVIYVLRPTA
jgi:hypothetical protein